MKKVKRKETIGNGRPYFTRSKKRQEEAAANEKDLISSLPLDLKLQILVKLPLKCIAKFISVSKLWSSTVRGKDLTELFVSQSSTRPSILFILGNPNNIQGFHSCSQEDPSSGNRRTTSNIPISKYHLSPPVRGLVCGHKMRNDLSKVICNPSTGQFVMLPRVTTRRRRPNDDILNFLGYDPINDVYKVLCMTVKRFRHKFQERVVSEEHQVFTLGAREEAWRMIECRHPHCPATNGLCKGGVVYYGAWYKSYEEGSLVVSFDLRSEDFGAIKLPEAVKFRHYRTTELVNYHEGIALVDLPHTLNIVVVDMWVLKDVKKQEWSKISFLLPDIVRTWSKIFYCKGTIVTGEIIFVPYHLSNPFFLVYYDLKRNNASRVEIKGVKACGDGPSPIVFFDHMESPMVLDKEILIRG